MKKWTKPELLSLGVENTFEDSLDSTISNGQDDNIETMQMHWYPNKHEHPCHTSGKGHFNYSCDHNKNTDCKIPGHYFFDRRGNKIVICCS